MMVLVKNPKRILLQLSKKITSVELSKTTLSTLETSKQFWQELQCLQCTQDRIHLLPRLRHDLG